MGKLHDTASKQAEMQHLREFLATLGAGTYLAGILEGIEGHVQMQMDADHRMPLLHILDEAGRREEELAGVNRTLSVQIDTERRFAKDKGAQLEEVKGQRDTALNRAARLDTALHGETERFNKEWHRAERLQTELDEVRRQAELEVLRLKAALWDLTQKQAAQ